MTLRIPAALAALCLSLSLVPAEAQSGRKLTHDQLVKLTGGGIVLNLGGPGQGYAGKLTLKKDGTGKGSAKTDAGQTIRIAGTWQVRDGRFCRTWAGLDGGKEVCETWYLTAPNAVEVYNGKTKLGVNSW